MAKPGTTRKRRRKSQTDEPQGRKVKDDDPSVRSPPSDEETQSLEYVSKDFEPEDLSYFFEAERTPNWEFDEKVLKTLPRTIHALTEGKKIENGKAVKDPDATTDTVAKAANVLVRMQGQVLAQSRQSNQINLKIHSTRHPKAETPTADDGKVVDAVGFHEKCTMEESLGTVAELDQLGLLHLIVQDPAE